jgi:hypothetical protein
LTLTPNRCWIAPLIRVVLGATIATTILLSLTGCGTSRETDSQGSPTSTEPSYVSEPFTHQQQLIEQGARFVVTDGCSACHLTSAGRRIAPSFANLAGHRITLTDGRRVLVDEHFLREALRNPGHTQVKGYDPALMRRAITHLRLASHPQQVAALAAFIEQIGPEPG